MLSRHQWGAHSLGGTAYEFLWSLDYCHGGLQLHCVSGSVYPAPSAWCITGTGEECWLEWNPHSIRILSPHFSELGISHCTVCTQTTGIRFLFKGCKDEEPRLDNLSDVGGPGVVYVMLLGLLDEAAWDRTEGWWFWLWNRKGCRRDAPSSALTADTTQWCSLIQFCRYTLLFFIHLVPSELLVLTDFLCAFSLLYFLLPWNM
jgi:hypothetical protein